MELNQTGVLVHVSSRLPLADYNRLVKWAAARGLVRGRGERPNVSGALRQVVALGLAAAEQEQRGEEVTT